MRALGTHRAMLASCCDFLMSFPAKSPPPPTASVHVKVISFAVKIYRAYLQPESQVNSRSWVPSKSNRKEANKRERERGAIVLVPCKVHFQNVTGIAK